LESLIAVCTKVLLLQELILAPSIKVAGQLNYRKFCSNIAFEIGCFKITNLMDVILKLYEGQLVLNGILPFKHGFSGRVVV
jgi:hypothetical protein